MDRERFARLLRRIDQDLSAFHVGQPDDPSRLSGRFSLHRGAPEPDLYGMVDAAYVLYTTGALAGRTDRNSRGQWARRILDCQGGDGWFDRRNLRGHSREHATAYAIAGLRLLELEQDEEYLSSLRPLDGFLPFLTSQAGFRRWIRALDFRLSPFSLLKKNLGWHYIWSGSHVGGGVAASLGMVGDQVEDWWPGRVDVDRWFGWYFDWLDENLNPASGYWQRAFWNLIYRRPNFIELGGAAHFYWIYTARGRPFPNPEPLLRSTLGLQKPHGLYRDRPRCIDLDGNYCVVRAYLQLPRDHQEMYRERVYGSLEANFKAVVNALCDVPLEEMYANSHDLPGALAALVECSRLPGFRFAEYLAGWQHPLEKACWL